LAKIPKFLNEHIDPAYPDHTCQMATVLPDGYAQITLRGSVMVFDQDRLAIWERGRGSTSDSLSDGTKVTIFFRKTALREAGLLPKSGVARFYGTAEVHKSGTVYDEVWRRPVQPEKDRDPDKKGYALLINVERAEDFGGDPLPADA
jgi:hypothetical protein